jgi:uncharacterized protein (TIGR02266 family)
MSTASASDQGGHAPRDPRIAINHEFQSVEQFIREYVSNISRSGVFIRSDDPLPVGTRVRLCFSVIVEEIETVEGVGEVVRLNDNPSGMGVVFVQLTSVSRNLIERILTREESR